MAKRELSSTLKNLKFMQRAAPKEEKSKEEEEEVKPNGKFVSSSNVSRKCVVIVVGDPHPGTLRGRMSFQNFNPSIDKLNDEAVNGQEAEASTSAGFQTGRNLYRENGASKPMDLGNNDADGELKRKQPKTFSQTSHSKKLHKDAQGNKQPSPSESSSSRKPSKREKLDWNVLVPQKSHSKKMGG